MQSGYSGTESTTSARSWSLPGTIISTTHQFTAGSTARRLAPGSFTTTSRNRARERFDDDPSCYVGDINKLLVVVIEQRLVIRFKRFLPDKTSRNIPTKQVEDYRMQRDIAGLHEQFNLIGELSNLEAGYILDQFDSEMQETWLVCPSGIRANAWMRQIQNRTATAKVPGASIAPLFPWSPATVQPKEKSIVTIKRSDKEGETS